MPLELSTDSDHDEVCIIQGIELGVTSPATPLSTTTTLNTCTITGGDDGDAGTAGEACIFPWHYSGQWFAGCADPDNSNSPWCPTEINCDGTYIKWGYCDGSCFTTTTTTTTTTTPAGPARCNNTGVNSSYQHGSYSVWECDGR